MAWMRRREIPMLITALTGFVMIFSYYFEVSFLKEGASMLSRWGVIILAFAMAYGVLTLTVTHGKRILQRGKDWQYSLILVAFMWTMVIAGVIPPMVSNPYATWIYTNLIRRMHVTAYALLCPYIAAAAYRAFRARSLEAGLLLVAGVLVMLKNAPIGAAIFPPLAQAGAWIYSVPNMAAQRGILIAIATGTVALGVRIILGYEKTVLGEEVTGGGA